MNIRPAHLFLLPVLITGFGFLTHRATAQTITVLHTFTVRNTNSLGTYTNSDGATPMGVILSSNTLYGTTFDGNLNGSGTVFALNTNGTGFTNLHKFTAVNFNPSFAQTNSDGANPNTLILSNDTLYGTTAYGSTNGSGTLFKINTDGTGFTNIYRFKALNFNPSFVQTNSDGANPTSGLLLLSNTLYGTTLRGGSSGNGTVFKVNTDGTGFTNLHTFAVGISSFPNATNSEGANPGGDLTVSNNTLYGTTFYGGTNGRGTVFRLNTDGSGFTNMHTFAGGNGVNTQVTNTDGAHPSARLLLSGNTLYGRAKFGGSSRYGTLFAIKTDGTGFTNLHTFAAGVGSYPNYTNSEGANPNSSLILSGNALLGTASYGGSFGNGTLFQMNTNGTGFTNLYSFAARSAPVATGTNSSGANPVGIILSGNTLFGTTESGGTNGSGTVYSLAWGTVSVPFPPKLQAQLGAGALTFQWPTNYPGYTVQDATNPASSNSWANVTVTPAVVGTNYSVTFPATNASRFFRLRLP